MVKDQNGAKGRAITELMLETAQVFFRLRALGQKEGLISQWGGGSYGFLRSLAILGPLTVPQIARMRPTSRQRMQRLADELAAAGFVEFVKNPGHRRSQLVRLTDAGEQEFSQQSAHLVAIASSMGAALSTADVETAIEVVRVLSGEAKSLFGSSDKKRDFGPGRDADTLG